MPRVRRVSNADGSPYGRSFDCPGCGERHAIPTPPSDRAWGFNGDPERPTFTPSILVRSVKDPWGPNFDATPTVCHSFVTDGRIQYLPDSTHALAGQTVDLPEVIQ